MNQRPAPCKGAALPTELTSCIGIAGFEPAAFRSQSGRATRLRYIPSSLYNISSFIQQVKFFMSAICEVPRVGFEPTRLFSHGF